MKSESTARNLSRQLKKEREDHKQTRAELQQEIERVWRLVPSHYISLMGVYPPLRKLLHVLSEAADLQDPSRGVPTEDTMRTQFVHTGERASTSMTESASQHSYYRQRVREFERDLEHLRKEFNKKLAGKAHDFAQTVGISEWEYDPPSGRCDECGKVLYQSTTGRTRRFCSDTCRQRALRVTKRRRLKSFGSA